MGLAASQARLLSITSRMADNELRSQLINNAKMRLTTDSARVSDEYIAALNKTQMMFTNFDAEGNEVYQDLTFNALTSYSSYNTQYGIVNSAGQIIVSNTDATRFERSSNLEDFLKQYGLEKKTDYFDIISNSPEYIEKGIGYYDDYGVWQQMNVSIDEMKAIYEGEIDNYGINHYGEIDSENSIELGDYNKLVSEYTAAKDFYKTTLKQQMKNWVAGNTILNGYTQEFKSNGQTLEYYYLQAEQLARGTTLNESEKTNLLNKFFDFANQVGFIRSGNNIIISPTATNQIALAYQDKATGRENDEFLAILNAQLDLLSTPVGQPQTTYGYENGTPHALAELDENGQLVRYVHLTNNTKYISAQSSGDVSEKQISLENYTQDTAFISDVPSANSQNIKYVELNDTYTYKPLYFYKIDESGNQLYTYEGDTNYDQRGGLVEYPDCVAAVYENKHYISTEEYLSSLESLFASFRNNLLDNLGEQVFITSDTATNKAYNDYIAATKNLADFIYGRNSEEIKSDRLFETYLAYFDDPSWILSNNSAISDVDNDGFDDKVNKSHLNPWAGTATTAAMPYAEVSTINGKEYTTNYQVVKDLFLLKCMQDHYGTPNYTWIDANNPNENGDAKAQWYTNLYEKMKQGYKRIGDGLGNNQEWMQFAFESGLVHMEQVNKKLEWTPTLYSNCSTITESTVDVDITIAEAKYKKEMNKIQAKDKQYDIQLKNIDTEHEALKQEYETIKDVINKNVERNFKLFTQG